MRRMFVVAAFAALVASVAYAATLGFSWQNATQNTDGSVIPATGPGALVSTTVEYGPCNAAKDALTSVTGTVVTPYPGTAPPAPPNVGPGTWCGHAKHANTYGGESAWTAVKSRVVEVPIPNPPSNFSFGQ